MYDTCIWKQTIRPAASRDGACTQRKYKISNCYISFIRQARLNMEQQENNKYNINIFIFYYWPGASFMKHLHLTNLHFLTSTGNKCIH